MTVSLTLPPDIEIKLRERAAAQGQELSVYVSQLVQNFASMAIPISELSGPIHQKFIESGMSDDELAQELERAKHEMRIERRNKHTS